MDQTLSPQSGRQRDRQRDAAYGNREGKPDDFAANSQMVESHCDHQDHDEPARGGREQRGRSFNQITVAEPDVLGELT